MAARRRIVPLVSAWFGVVAAGAIDLIVARGSFPLVGLLASTSGSGGSAGIDPVDVDIA